MAVDLPSGTVTFLFTDIEGSTRLAQDHRDRWEELRARHHVILHSAMERHGGHVFQIIGDAFCVAFNTASEALGAALEAQRRLQQEEWGDAPLKVRMGINTGEARAGPSEDGSGGYTGYTTMARTQRVMSTAYGGQILLSNTSADLLLGELPAGVSLRDMKHHRLKGLLNPEHLWQVVAPGIAQDFPALQSLNSIPNNLPIQLTGFIGRQKEIAEIKDRVEHNRLVTLTGSGGVGKTRHSLQVAAELLDAFPDGVWMVDLAPVSNPELVLPTLAAILGVREDEGRTLGAALQDHLQAKHVLVLLDNCEHLLEACAQMADALLHTCADLKILASSREALGMAGEVSFRIPSLSLPDADHLPSLERLTQYDSVRLFIERAAAVKPDFMVTNENAPAVAQVCARLDGIPLAIELAAARLKGLSVEQVSQRLDDRFRLLTAGSRTALPRHQTLRAMIQWSYDLLSEPERAVLRRLAVFNGDWTLEAAEAVCSQPGPAAPEESGPAVATDEVMDLLLRLVDKSLVVAEEHGGQERYRMLETIREFSHDKLSESGEEAALRRRHLGFFLQFSEQAREKLQSAEPLIWLNQLGTEYENLRAALEWARGAESGQPALRLAQATEHLGDVQYLRGLGSKAMPLYQEALELWQSTEGADRTFGVRLHRKIIESVARSKFTIEPEHFRRLLKAARASSAGLLEALEAMKDEPPNIEKVRLLTTLSVYAYYLCMPADWQTAERYALEAAEMAEGLDAPVELSTALGSLSEQYYLRGLWRERVQAAMRRLAITRGAGFKNMQERAQGLIDTGAGLMQVGEYVQALTYTLEGEQLAAQIQAVDLERWALTNRSLALLRLDRWDEILALAERTRDLQRRYPLEQIGPSCQTIAVIASVHAMRGDLEAARIHRQEAQDMMTSLAGPPSEWARTLHY